MYSEAPFLFFALVSPFRSIIAAEHDGGQGSRPRKVAQIQPSQQRGGLYPKHRYSAPVAAHGSACTSWTKLVSYRQNSQYLYTEYLSTWHAPSVSDTVLRPARLAGPNTVPSNGPTAGPTAVLYCK